MKNSAAWCWIEGALHWTQDLGCPANGIQLPLRAASEDGPSGVEYILGEDANFDPNPTFSESSWERIEPQPR